MTLAAGTRLGPYGILAPLGAGGMGEVYCARDAVLPTFSPKMSSVWRRFEREAQVLASLNHPSCRW